MSSESDESSAFEVSADYDQTPADYFQEKFDKWIGAPGSILWADYRGRFGLLTLALYILMGTVGVLVLPVPEPNMGPRLVPAFTDPNYILGTDGLGQGLLALMVHATPAMFKMMISGAVFGNFMGVTVGLISGYYGGKIDKVLMTMVDILSSIPGIPLLIILAAILEPKNPWLVGIILNIQGWAGGARGLRSQVLPLADEEHVEAARALGQPVSDLLVKEILPHLLPLVFIGFLRGATGVVSASVALYFLGILPFTTLNWGVVLNFAYEDSTALYDPLAAHWLLVPLVTVVGLTLGNTLLAQAFDQVFNPRVRARHKGRKTQAEDETTVDTTTETKTQMNP